MKKSTALLFLIYFLCPNAYSCECVWKSVRETFDRSVLVLKGRVLSIDTAYVIEPTDYEALVKDSTKELRHSLFFRSLTVKVDRLYKGKKTTTQIRVLTPIDGAGTCSFNFEVGKTYIIYTYPQPGRLVDFKTEEKIFSQTGRMPRIPPVFEGEPLYTDVCMRAQLFDKKEEKELISLKRN